MTTPAEDEMTELVDATFPRVDLVGKGANGVPRFLIAKETAGGLLDSAFVRSLISKSEPGTGSEEQVTVSGSPAAIAKMIHAAAQKPAAKRGNEPDEAPAIAKALADYEAVVKAKYSADDKKKMLAAGHAIKNENGDPAYPIGDKEDLSNAIHAVGRGGSDHDHIRAYVIRRAKALGASSEIPDNWNSDGSLKESVSKDMGPDLDDSPDQMDAMDVTVPLAAPDTDAPGDPTDPGSPAWEAIDAATACKWTSILSRARVAIDILAEREMLEAASADPDDAENAWDLQDVCCAIDYAIGVLAPFAVSEQSEADCGSDAMAAISKAMAGFDTVPMDRIEALAQVAKAGRVLSSANEGLIRDAASKLQTVLASLPAAPQADDSGQPVAKQKEAFVPATDTTAAAAPEAVAKEGEATPEAQAAAAGPVSAGGTTGMGQPRQTGPDAALPGDGPQAGLPGDVPGRQVIKAAGLQVAVYDATRTLAGLVSPDAILTEVAKADDGGDGESSKPSYQAVFDQDGKLVGVVDPDAIMPVAGADAKTDDGSGDEPKPDGHTDGAADLDPQPAGDAGMAADDVTKSQPDPDNDNSSSDDAREVLKSIVSEALDARFGSGTAVDVAKFGDVAALTEELNVIKARLLTVEGQPAAPKTFVNGQTPPPGQLRGQDRPQGGIPQVDVAKAAEQRRNFLNADPAQQNQIAGEMQQQAIDVLSGIHAAPRTR